MEYCSSLQSFGCTQSTAGLNFYQFIGDVEQQFLNNSKNSRKKKLYLIKMLAILPPRRVLACCETRSPQTTSPRLLHLGQVTILIDYVYTYFSVCISSRVTEVMVRGRAATAKAWPV